MVRVRTRPEYRREPAARGNAQGRERLVSRRRRGGRHGRGLPARLDGEHPFVGELERRNVDRNSGPVRAGFTARHPVARSAFEARSCPDRDERRSELTHQERCHQTANPARKGFGKAAGDDWLLGKPDGHSRRALDRDPDKAHRVLDETGALRRGRSRGRLDDNSSACEPGSALGRRPVSGGTGWGGGRRSGRRQRGGRRCWGNDDRLGSAELGRAERRLGWASAGGSLCAPENDKAGETGHCPGEPPWRSAPDGAGWQAPTAQRPCSRALLGRSCRGPDGQKLSSIMRLLGVRATSSHDAKVVPRLEQSCTLNQGLANSLGPRKQADRLPSAVLRSAPTKGVTPIRGASGLR